ncbi:MAG TPA: energy transducer TonB [Jiangellaceae bacterium]|nr:energy transducer TonB [Jiangellaceae bacterium]
MTAVLTPPVPVEITPPTHPLPYRMILDAPGLSSTARLEAVEARVRLRLVVRADGSVAGVDVAISSGRRELDAAALESARHWRFLPARRDGEPIDSVALIWVAFVASP